MKFFIKLIAAFVCLLLGLLLFPKFSKANASITITEIAAYEKSNFEWIEIYNPTSSSIDITGWKFWENDTNHSLTLYRGDLLIEAGEYAVIADVAENVEGTYPEFTGTLVDSSWSSLRESGEEIGLKDSDGNIIELFVYPPAPDYSLQKIDGEWVEHSTGNTIGRENTPSAAPAASPPSPGGDPDATGVGEGVASKTQALITGTVVINEFVSDPLSGESEWIELFNSNDDAVDLSGWTITEGSGSVTVLENQINAHDFYLIEKPKGSLNNGGDIIILKDSSETIMDQVSYGDYGGAALPSPGDPLSLARSRDGLFSFDSSADFELTETPTPGSSNIIIQQEAPKEIVSAKTEKAMVMKTKGPILNEIYANPPGSDLHYEFIEIVNIGEDVVSLKDWKLRDKSKQTHIFPDISLPPLEIIVVERKDSRIALNNYGDEIQLIAPSGKKVDSFKYSFAQEGLSIARADSGEWSYKASPSKGVENGIESVNHEPVIEIYCPKKVERGEIYICDASDSYDPDGDPLLFEWEVNGTKHSSPSIQLVAAKSGKQAISITVSDQDLQKTKNVTISVLEATNSTLSISSAGGQTEEIRSINPEDVYELEKGDKVVLQGIVTVLPGVFSKQIMYINGLQIYMNKSQWPALQRGDKILVSGTVSESRGEKRVNIKSAEDILFMELLLPPEAKPVLIDEINNDEVGGLVNVTGAITELSSSKAVLDDGESEIVVKFKKGSEIKKSDLIKGDNYTISGIVILNDEEHELLPRDIHDIQHIVNTVEQADALVIPERTTGKRILKFLLPITLSLLTVMGVLGGKKYIFKK